MCYLPSDPRRAQPSSFLLSQPRIKAHQIPNLGLQDIINVLLDNQIPPLGWIILTCLGLPIWMPIMLGTASIRPYTYDEIDNEWLACLHIYGTPPPIAYWDGWCSPSEGDIA